MPAILLNQQNIYRGHGPILRLIIGYCFFVSKIFFLLDLIALTHIPASPQPSDPPFALDIPQQQVDASAYILRRVLRRYVRAHDASHQW
jgi:hypothetical protein